MPLSPSVESILAGGWMSMVLWEERREYRDGRLVVMSSDRYDGARPWMLLKVRVSILWRYMLLVPNSADGIKPGHYCML